MATTSFHSKQLQQMAAANFLRQVVMANGHGKLTLQIYTVDSQGIFPRQKTTVNSHRKFSRQVATAN